MDVEVHASILKANVEPYQSPDSSIAGKFVNKERENHVILPVGMVRLDTDDEYVIANNIDYQTFAETKRIKKGQPIQRDYEVIVLDSYTRNDDDVSYREYDDNDDAFYGNERFQQPN